MQFPDFHIILTLTLLLIVSVCPIPISNQIPSGRFNDPEKIFYPGEISEKESKPIIIQKNRNVGFCNDSMEIGVRLAADVDQGNLTCYEVGTQGPCASNLKFYTIPGLGDIGMCDCDQEVLGLAYSTETKECHHLYRKEYCKEGHWLTLTEEGLGCGPNPCIENTTASASDGSVVLFNDECVTLYEPCINTLGEMGNVGYDSYNELNCLPGETNYSITKSVPQLKCAEGTRWSTLTSSCRKAIKFNFS